VAPRNRGVISRTRYLPTAWPAPVWGCQFESLIPHTTRLNLYRTAEKCKFIRAKAAIVHAQRIVACGLTLGYRVIRGSVVAGGWLLTLGGSRGLGDRPLPEFGQSKRDKDYFDACKAAPLACAVAAS